MPDLSSVSLHEKYIYIFINHVGRPHIRIPMTLLNAWLNVYKQTLDEKEALVD